MPLPAARDAMPDVGAARGQGPGLAPCAHPQVDGLLWRSQSEQRLVRSLHVQEVRCPDVRGLPEKAAAASRTRRTHNHRVGQCQIPPCQTAEAMAAEISQGPHAPVPAALQPAAGAYRAGLEAGSPDGHAQSYLPHVERTARYGWTMLRPLAETQCRATKTISGS